MNACRGHRRTLGATMRWLGIVPTSLSALGGDARGYQAYAFEGSGGGIGPMTVAEPSTSIMLSASSISCPIAGGTVPGSFGRTMKEQSSSPKRKQPSPSPSNVSFIPVLVLAMHVRGFGRIMMESGWCSRRLRLATARVFKSIFPFLRSRRSRCFWIQCRSARSNPND
jgi:hypothetical protein